MPDINAGNTIHAVFHKARALGAVALAAVALASCSSGVTPGVTPGSASLAPASTAPVMASRPQAAPAAKRTVNVTAPASTIAVAMPSIIGAPKPVAGKLKKKLSGKLSQRNVKFVNGAANYKLRGYVAASPEKRGVKVAYIWDVSNKAGKRQHRIIGEQIVAGGSKKNPWSGVDDKALNAIARKTADDLSGWLARRSGSSTQVAAAAPSRVTANRVPSRSKTRSVRPARKTAARGAAKTPARGMLAMVMPVSGAPGDGKTSLTRALKQKLYDKGIKLTNRRTASVYQVRGVVQVGKTSGASQPIRIDWKVYDPRGKRLGVVTQKNKIPPGSLNGKWGPIATAAAGAAADGIAKLLPKSTQSM